jgi:dTDP-glucose 4,6-dehydratase
MKALVAGGAGFIGSHLCEFLIEKGYEVHALDSFITGSQGNLAGLTRSPKFKFFEQDLTRKLDLTETYDEIYNLASPASPVDFAKMPVFILDTAHGHRQLLELATAQGARILYASTSEVYGDPLEHPQNESYWGHVNPVGPRGCYDEAKRFGEALTMAYQRSRGTQTRIVRIFNTYGPRMRPDDGRIIPNFFMQALQRKSLTIYGDGSQTRSFCFVSDMVAGLFALMRSSATTPVNIGNPIERRVLEIADEINRLTGNETPHTFLTLPEDDPKRRCPDIGKARRELSWEPKVDLGEGLSRTLEFFKTKI